MRYAEWVRIVNNALQQLTYNTSERILVDNSVFKRFLRELHTMCKSLTEHESNQWNVA